VDEKTYLFSAELYRLGRQLKYYELDEEEYERIGQRLIEMSSVCENCDGTGQDGDPPDSAGVGGGIWPCSKCQGKGNL
jgi:hypothetical protein